MLQLSLASSHVREAGFYLIQISHCTRATMNKCVKLSTCTATQTAICGFAVNLGGPVLAVYIVMAAGMCGGLSSAVKCSGGAPSLAPARHALINIAAAEASLNTRLLSAVMDGCR